MEQMWAETKGRRRGDGEVDYRVARRSVLRAVEAGEVPRQRVCDAQPELMRVARECSEEAGSPCPVCGGGGLRLVRFVFGPRLPRGGRCVASARELTRLAARSGTHRCYVVEVCTGCAWNHLLRSFLLSPPAQD